MKRGFTVKKRPYFFTSFFALVFVLASQVAFGQTVDCSNSANCGDAYCNFAANIEKGCNCFDGIDNDSDGQIDKADLGCAPYYGLTFVGEGSDCSILPPGINDPFDLVDDPVKSGQNTSDTQSKVSVGDVDGDGTPDAVITSKWGGFIKVVSTIDGTEKSKWDLSSDIGNTFNNQPNNGACKVSKLKFEHENLIADIDGNGVAEIFGVVSNRGGSPTTPPTCFYFVAFTYSAGVLTPLYQAVNIGTDRPGTFGIADMDGDGKAELYMRDRIYAAETGKLLATSTGNTTSAGWDTDINAGPVAVNISGTDVMELVCGTKIFGIADLSNRNAASPATLTLLHDMNTIPAAAANKCFVKLANDIEEYGIDTHSMCSVADMDRDGNIDVVISGALNSNGGRTAVFYWNVTLGTVDYALTPSSADMGWGPGDTYYDDYLTGWIWGTGRVNLGDIDGDGDMDLNFIAGSHLMALTIDAAGTGLENLWTQNLTPVATSPVPEIGFRQIEDSRSGVITTTVYDFNNDGDPELVYRDSYKLVVTDGATGLQDLLVRECKSHTYTEGPVVADVNGDGATDICVACFRGPGLFKIDDKINGQNLGEFRLYYSEGNEWLPTRKVWNQPGYFVVNINDDLTLPFPQYDQTTIFGLEDCANGTPGPQMPLNGFLNQVPNLSAGGCPVFPAPDLAYHGDDPDNPGVDENGDGVYTPAVEVIPPICGDLTFQTRFHIVNDGDLPINDDIPVSFFKANPTSDTIELEDLLYSTTISISNLAVGGTLTTAFESFDGTGGTFTMFIVLNNDGTILPIDTTASSPTECRIANNIYSLEVVPDPFTTEIIKLQDNYKCENTAPDNGALQVKVFKNGIEQPYTDYAFQWFAGDSASHTLISGATDYNIFGLAEGDYTVQVTNIAKGCVGSFVDTTIVRTGNDPTVTIEKLSDQTKCDPPDGKLEATIAEGNAGFTFEWFDVALTPLGITGSTASNLKAGNYVLIVKKDGCEKNVAAPTILDPQVPDASADVVQHVIDCINPNSGIITADAVLGGVAQDPANYTFEWYEYDSVGNIQGSILPAGFGTGPTRTGLPAGGYQVVIKDNNTKCESLQTPFVSVVSQTVVPVASITEVAPQTSCDPAQPNGILTASAAGLGLTSPDDYTFEWFVGDNTLPENKIPNATSPSTVSGVSGETVNQVLGGGIFYTVKVTTANNCSDTEKLIITENIEIPVITLTSTPNSICDPTIATNPFNGSVSATVTFDGAAVTLPDPNFTFTWHDGPLASDPVIPVADDKAPAQSALEHGYYTVSVERTDLHCVAVPVSEEVLNTTILPSIVSDSIPSTNCVVTYNGNPISNGEASITTVDGAAPTADYAFLWTDNASPTDVDGLTTSSITAIQGGFDYTVEVTNLLTGCKNTDLVSLPDKSVVPVVTLAVEQNNSICDATLTDPPVAYNGRIAVSFTTPSGNASDYKYTWRNVTDNLPLGDTPPINNGQGVTLVTQFGGLNGNKDYNVIAENTVLGCTSGAAQIYVPNSLVLPVIETDSIASTNCVLNYGGNMIANGEAFVLTVDGVAPNPAIHDFLWSDNGSTTDADGRTTSTITAIQGGFIYTVQVTNLLTGCRNTDPVPLSDASVVPVVTLTVEQNNTICDASLTDPPIDFNGRIAASFTTLSGNATDYKYTWNNVTDADPLGDTPPVNGGPGVTLITQFGGLEGNKDYSVIAENTVLGCTSGAAQIYLPNTFALPVIETDSIASTNCVLNYGGNTIANGEAFVLTVDGVAPNPAIHDFLWSDNGSTTDADGRTTSTITEIQGGFIYTVQVTNLLTGCRNTDPVPLSDASVVPVVTLTVEQNNTICDATLTDPPVDFNGRIAASFTTPSGNAADYKYTWNNVTDADPLGDTPPVNGGPGVTLITQFGGLEGNKDYTVIAENTVLGCTSGAAQIYLPNTFALPVIETDSIASTNCVLNYGGNMIANGEAFVLTVDGVAPNPAIHDFLWSDNGSSTSAAGRTTSSITALQGGFIYTVQVTNLLTGCRNTDPVPLADASVMPAIDVTVLQENTICDIALGFNGQLTTSFLTPSGDPTLYKYTWKNITDNLAAGVTDAGNVFTGPPALLLNQQGGLNGGRTYGVIAEETDLGCTSGEATVFLPNNFALPVIKTDSIASTNCVVEFPAPGNVISNGSAFVSLIDGKVPGAANAVTGTDYSYEWNGTSVAPAPLVNGVNTVTISSIQGGYVYTVEVTNLKTGCTNTDPVALPDKSVIPVVDVTVLQENTICDITLGFNGQLTTTFTTPSGDANEYQYTWTNTTDAQPAGVTDAGSVFPGPPPLLLNQQGGLEGGKTYGVVAVETVLGCTSGQATVFLPNNFALPVIQTDSVPSTNCVIEYPAPGTVISNGSAFVSLVDGKVPGAANAITGTDYSYEWNGTSVAPAPLVNGLTTVTISDIQGGYVYTVEVTNIHTGCTNTDPVALPDKSVVPVISATVLQPNTICDVGLGTNGQLTTNFITPSGDPNLYVYTWHNETDNDPEGTTSLGTEFGGLLLNQQGGLNGGKTYSVTAEETDLGCTSGEVQVFLPNDFTLPVVTIDSTASTNCVVEFPAPGTVISNGTIEITDVDGIPVGAAGAITGTDYSYSWTDNVAAPAVSIGGSTATQFLNVLEGGFEYTVEVRNILTGCTNTRAVALPKKPLKPTIAVTKTDDNETCDATLDGTGRLIAIVTSGGVPQNNPDVGPVALPADFTITWSTSDNGDVLDLQFAGAYSASVVNTALGCTSDPDDDVVLDDFIYPTITIDAVADVLTGVTDQTSCDTGNPNGAINAKIESAVAGDLTYEWFEGIGTGGTSLVGPVTGQATGTYTGIASKDSDDYSIQVINETTGCASLRSAFIPNDITYPEITLVNTNQVTICRPTPDGEAQATLTAISALPGEDYDIFYVYTFTGGVAPTDPLVIKASTDLQNVASGNGVPAAYVDMAPGYLTALVVDNNTACESNPFTVEIIDNTVANQIAIDGVQNAALCGGVGGAIDIDVTGGVAPQTYAWYKGVPGNNPANGNINFFTNPPDMTAATQVLTDAAIHHTGTVNGADEDLGLGSQPSLGVGAGTYTVVIEDFNGCGAYFVETVPFATAPTITVTPVDNSRCVGPFDGEVNVTVNGLSPTGYQIEIYAGNSPDPGSKLVDTGGTINTPGVNIPLSATLLQDGQYFVQVLDMDGINPTCPLGSIHTLDQLAKEPLITIDNIVQNTSCDPGSGDGEVELTITPDAAHDLVNAFPDYQINTITPAPVGFAPIDPLEDAAGVASSATIGGFGPGGFVITVTDVNSGCESDMAVNIPDQPVLPQIFTVASADDSHCAPQSNGEIEVTAVGPGLFTEYHFEWYSDPNDIGVNPADYEDDGDGLGTGGELFNLSKGVAAWTVGATNGLGNGNRTFYVRAARVLGNGVGCYTQVEQRTVLDLHKTPNLTLTPFSNTACLPGQGDGVVRAITDIAVDPLDANVVNGTYTYSWNIDPPGGNATPSGAIARNTNFDITELPDNGGVPYSVATLNSVSGCASTSTVVIPTVPVPITLISFTKADQLICNPDGNIAVTEIEIDATNTATPGIISFNSAALLTGSFSFEWFNAADDGDSNPSTFNPALALDNAGTPITDVTLSEDNPIVAQRYLTMGEGSYYVVATRDNDLTIPGAGCPIAPTRVDIIENANYPVITTLDAFANTSCDAGIVEGRIEIAVQTTSGVGAESGSTYSYDWDPDNNTVGAIISGSDNETIPPSYSAPPAPLGLGDALVDDTYTITVTNDYSGCTVSGQGIITPTKYPITIISTTKENQLICNPDGSITVNQIDIDASNSDLGVFTFPGTGPLTPDFHYQWFNAADDGDSDASTFDDTAPLTDDASVGGDVIDNPVLTGDGSLTDGQYAPMAAGTYYVIATRDPTLSPGAGCSTEPVRVEILDKHINPVITDLDAFANTSCDAGVVEGRIELTVETNGGVGPDGTSTYTYDWVPLNNTGGTIAAGAATVTIPPTYAMPPAVLGIGDALVEGTYTITVTNDYSGCDVTGQGVVTPTKYPITIISTMKQDQLICNPDGSITVNQIDIDATNSNLGIFSFPGTGPLTEFTYEWFNADDDGDGDGSTFDDTQPLRDDISVGGDIIAIPTLTGDGSLTNDQFAPMAAGTYYVVATRDATLSPGAGCSTEPVRIEILDEHIDPVVTNLDAFANTSCDAGVVEGRIELEVETNSTVPAESGSTYTYDWTPINNTTGQILGGADNVTIPPTYLPPPAALGLDDALVDDTYTITITNDYSGCTTTTQGVVTPQKYPITLISFTKQDQLICDPDGRITVTQVTIDGSTSNLPSFNYVPASGDPLTDLANNFDLEWFNATNDGDNDANTFDNTIPIVDAGSLPITDVVLSEDNAETTQPFPTMGAGSYYVLATRKPGMSPGAGCSTMPVRVNIEDLHINPVITNLDAFANTSCDAGVVEGRVELTVSTTSGEPLESGSTYSYDWTPQNNTAGSFPNAGASVTLPPTYAAPPAILGLGDAFVDDTYTITVTNDYSRCTTTAQAVITPQKYPITLISFTKQDQLICDPDGRITVTQVTIDGSTSNLPSFNYLPGTGDPNTDLALNFDLEWFDATNDGDNDANTYDDGVPIVDGTSATITDVVLSDDAAETTQPFPTMGVGSYYVLATRKPGMSPGAGCSTLPVRVNIEDLHINPVITDLDAFANTSCDAGVVEGRIELTVNTTSGVPAESGSTYTYDWTPQNNTAGTFPSAGASVTLPPTYAAPPAVLALGDAFVDDTYTITVTNDYSGCTTTAQAVITPTKYPITLISFSKQDQLICDPDGRITVTQVTIDGSTSNLPSYDYVVSADPLTNLADNFNFEWFDAANDGDNDANTYDDTTPILDGASNPIIDVVLSEDGAETTQPFLTMGAGSYYVLATRKPGMTPGAGCSTLPIRVNIEDLHINPVITALEAFSNTSCDAGIVEGRIELTVNTTSGEPLESGSTYTYDWAASNPSADNPFGVGTNPGAAATAVIPPGYQTPPLLPSDALKNDTYSVTVTNDYSGCTTTTQAVITQQKFPITLISFTKQDQLICYPDGNITVTQVTIDGTASSLPSYSFVSSGDPLTNLTDNFDFQWFNANNDGDNNTSTFNSSIPLEDAGNTAITDDALSEDPAETAQPFPTMGAGTYYVLATRKAGMIPGAGCSTQPVRVDILDLHEDPELVLTYEPNSSCDPVNPNGVIIATASEKDGSIVDTYSFNWQIDGGPLTFGNPVNVDNHTGRLDNADDGSYVLTLTNVSNTGCDIVASIDVHKDLNRSIPNIIDVSTLDPLDCNPSAMAEVTSISIGGTTFYNNPPDNLDVIFDYEWYQGAFDPGNVIAGEVNHDLLNITAGTYFVLVEDLTTACKSTPKEVVINDDDIVYPVVTLDQSQLQISCPASFGTGQLTALADGNDSTNPNYDFSWFGSLDGTGPEIPLGNPEDSNVLSGLIAGDYSVTARDLTTNCPTTEFYIIQNESADFLPQLSLSTEPRRNCLVPDGVMLAREVGYDPTSGYPFAPNYSTEYYLGTNPDVTQNGTAMIDIPDPALNWNAVGLEIGIYTVKITDHNTGCIVLGETEVLDDRTAPIVTVVETNPNVNCDPLRPNGQLVATADENRVVGYSFDWFTGATATGSVIQTNNTLFSVTMGTYTVRITNDITGCFADGNGIINDGHVDPPIPIAEVKQHQTFCDPGPYDGWVAATVNGVIVNYTFDWYDGQAPKATADHRGHNYTERINGFYTVVAQDVTTGCFSPPSTVEVLDETVIPELTFRTTPSFCEDLPSEIRGGTGTAEVIISPEGMLSREITWTFLEDGAYAGSGNYVAQLYPGEYEVNVTTVQGCNQIGQTLVETEVLAYNLVTQNGDAKNDLFVVDCISRFPNNNVKIYNRSGVLVFEADGYNNNDVVFKGLGEKGVYAAGNELPAGTYFYIIDKRNGTKPKTGYLELVK